MPARKAVARKRVVKVRAPKSMSGAGFLDALKSVGRAIRKGAVKVGRVGLDVGKTALGTALATASLDPRVAVARRLVGVGKRRARKPKRGGANVSLMQKMRV